LEKEGILVKLDEKLQRKKQKNKALNLKIERTKYKKKKYERKFHEIGSNHKKELEEYKNEQEINATLIASVNSLVSKSLNP
jgi:hypothetical protein